MTWGRKLEAATRRGKPTPIKQHTHQRERAPRRELRGAHLANSESSLGANHSRGLDPVLGFTKLELDLLALA